MLRSTSAIPLMPIPPMPTKCTWCFFSNMMDPRLPTLFHQIEADVDDPLRGVGTAERARRLRHRRQALGVGAEPVDRLREIFRGQLAIEDHDRGAARDERLGVLSLMIVGRIG